MTLQHLEITNLRNYSFLKIDLGPGFNLVTGLNGSGKTSLLEAIYLLSLGRSFRSHLTSRIVRENMANCCVFAEITSPFATKISIGIEKTIDGKTQVRVNGNNLQSIAELTKLLPLQLINQDTFQLLTAGPKHRRQFLDWGLFHVEPAFFPAWKNFSRALQQRNAALRANRSNSEIQIWNHDLLANTTIITELRKHYVEQLTPIIQQVLADLLQLEELSITYYQGWDHKKNLTDIMQDSLIRDRQLGHTQFGPHRADLRIKIGGVPAEDILSRGQQKLLVCALSLTQGQLLQELTGKSCLYLIDDLASELDQNSLKKIIFALKKLNTQVIIAGVDLTLVKQIVENNNIKTFHVEQGQLNEY